MLYRISDWDFKVNFHSLCSLLGFGGGGGRAYSGPFLAGGGDIFCFLFLNCHNPRIQYSRSITPDIYQLLTFSYKKYPPLSSESVCCGAFRTLDWSGLCNVQNLHLIGLFLWDIYCSAAIIMTFVRFRVERSISHAYIIWHIHTILSGLHLFISWW